MVPKAKHGDIQPDKADPHAVRGFALRRPDLEDRGGEIAQKPRDAYRTSITNAPEFPEHMGGKVAKRFGRIAPA